MIYTNTYDGVFLTSGFEGKIEKIPWVLFRCKKKTSKNEARLDKYSTCNILETYYFVFLFYNTSDQDIPFNTMKHFKDKKEKKKN
jgi:hypothetical protein